MGEPCARAVLLDRDGVLNVAGNVHTPEELILLPGAVEAVKLIHDAGYLIFVVTNQGGVGLGHLTRKDLDRVHAKLSKAVSEAGGCITEIRACTHKPHARCYCRKPKPGLLVDLIREYGIDPKISYMVGDRETDIRAGQRAGVRTVYVGNGPVPRDPKPDWSFPGLREAAEVLWKGRHENERTDESQH